VGAFGQGSYVDEPPRGAYTGNAVNLLLSAVGKTLDGVHVLSYNAGTTYSVTTAYAAYKSLFSGKVTIGVEVPLEQSGDHFLTLAELKQDTAFVLNQTGDAGISLWALQKYNATFSAQTIAQQVCNDFNLGNCTKPLFPYGEHVEFI